MTAKEPTSGSSGRPAGRGADRRDTRAWSTPRPERIPRPTPAPAALALGASLLALGVVTSWLLSAFGAALVVVAVVIWIRELHHEHTH